ncbi:MAG: S49 family peptidase [Treponema sp.]|jgi:ClpP class serine protease|nr:S49 family peptidase [Treponema sp.]
MIKTFWALSPEELDRFFAFREMEKRIRQDLSVELIEKIKAESATVANAEGQPLYERENGIAKITIYGILEAKRTLSSFFMGDTTTYAEIGEATVAADEDFQVREIQYHINSSGGAWDGLDFCAEIIKNTGKPTTAIIYTGVHSAAYFLASQSDHIYAATKGSMAGSIGVALELFDRTEQEGKKGIRRLVFTNSQSRDKRPDLATEAGASVIQEELDAIYKIFEDRVVEGRSTKDRSADTMRSNIRSLRGRSVTAERALELGLIDGILSGTADPAAVKNNRKGESKMDLKEFLAKNPGAENEILAYARTKIDPKVETDGKAESERIHGILTLAGVRLTDDVKQALIGGMTVEAYAVSALTKQREMEAKFNTESIPSPTTVAQLPGEQAGVKPRKEAEAIATEESVKALAKSLQ